MRHFSDGGEALSTAQIALQTGFPSQQAAIAIEALRAIGWVEREWEPEFRIWLWAPRRPSGYSAPDDPPQRENRLYTIAEASSATGVSEQAIRRRIERGTLTAWVPAGERRRVMTHEELLRVGLLRGAPRATRTRRGIMRMIEYLRGDPTRSLTTEELRWHTQRPRQTLEVALAVLRAAGVVTRGYHAGFGQYTWSWSDEP